MPFSPDLSPLCAFLLVMDLEEAGMSFPAVDSVLVGKKTLLVSHLDRTALKILFAFLEVKREVGVERVWPPTFQCFSTC